MHESSLGVHKIELVVKTSPGFCNSSSVGQHAYGAGNLGKISVGDDGWWLVVDTNLETSRTPIYELDGSLGLDGGNSSVHVLWHNVSTVQQATSHVLTVTGIAFDHLVGRFETSVGNFSNRELFVVSFLGRNNRCVGDQWEMDTGVGDQVSLELGKINVES